MNKTGNWRSHHRVLLTLLALTGLMAMAGTLALALSQTATLTIAKVTTPAGGQDFPITAAGFQGAIQTSLTSPRAIDQDSNGLLYVVGHRTSKVEVFDPSGNQVDIWGKKGKAEDELFRPDGLAVYDNGTGQVVYVADSGNDRVQYFTGTGEFLGGWGGTGSGDGQFMAPQSIAVSNSQTVYVADTFNHRIQVFSGTGDFIRSWGSEGSGDGEFGFPAGIAVSVTGEVFVADSHNHRIQVFSAEGQYLRQWGTQGNGPGQLYFPTSIAAAPGYVFVSDTYNNRVQKFTQEGRFVAKWGQAGTGDGEFVRPRGVHFDENSGLAYVIDIDNSRVEIFAQQTFWVNDGEEVSAVLPAGDYVVTEATEDPWMFASASCVGTATTPIENGVQLTLEDAASVTCTFENMGDLPTTYSAYLGYISR